MALFEKSGSIANTKTFLPFSDHNLFFFKQPIFFYFGVMDGIWTATLTYICNFYHLSCRKQGKYSLFPTCLVIYLLFSGSQ